MNDLIINGMGVVLMALLIMVVYMMFKTSGHMISRNRVRAKRKQARRLCAKHVTELEVGHMGVLVPNEKCEKCNRKDIIA